jgi:hypothetical protein
VYCVCASCLSDDWKDRGERGEGGAERERGKREREREEREKEERRERENENKGTFSKLIKSRIQTTQQKRHQKS